MSGGYAQKRRQRWLAQKWLKDPSCCYCGTVTKLDDDSSNPAFATCDHYVPLAKGGLDVRQNWRLCCRKCNCAKSDEWPEIWLLEADLSYEPVVEEVVPTALEVAFRAVGLR